MVDLSSTILFLSPTELFNTCAYDLFKELDNLDTPEVEWLEWDPDALILYLEKHGNYIENPIAKDKLLAVKSFAYRRDIGTMDAKAFEKLVHAFNNNAIVVDVIQEPEIEEVYYAVKEMHKLSEALNKYQGATKVDSLEFIGEIPGYVASVAVRSGLRVLPKLLSFAQEMLDFLGSNSAYNKNSDGDIDAIKSIVEVINSIGHHPPKEILDKYLLMYNNISARGDNQYLSILSRYFSLILYDPAKLGN